jgi:uncharacterized integral membrane protein
VRFLILLLVVALLAIVGAYSVLNIDERVDVTLPWIALHGVPQIYLALAALGLGILFMGFLSVADGARLRFSNRRLRRELDRFTRTEETPPVQAVVRPEVPEITSPFRGRRDDAARRPVIPAEDEPSGSDETPPYGV